MATIDSTTGLSHQFPDHLSTRVEADANANVTRTFGHFPFGEVWYETGTASKWKFTTYERDSESGLDYADFRFDSSRLGRFMSSDPLGGLAADPESLSRYTYVRNDPVSLSDPLALFYGPCFGNPHGPGCQKPSGPPPAWQPPFDASQGHCETSERDGWCQDFSIAELMDGPEGPDQCPEVPTHPRNVSINTNIHAAQMIRFLTLTDPLLGLYTFKKLVEPGGPWDYKQQAKSWTDFQTLGPSPYEDFGNFNYGATGAATGIPLDMLLRLAGRQQELDHTSKPEWGHWYQGPPYGDDPKDQAQIQAGYRYYNNGCKN